MVTIRARACTAIIACVVIAAACEGEPSGTQAFAILSVAHFPTPVPWSAGPGTTATCAAAPNVWRFNAVFIETGGVAVSFGSVVNVVDGVTQPALPAVVTIQASGTATLAREFCFSTSTQHTLQSTFTGTSGGTSLTVAAPLVTLSAR